jgi:hypothetical protein
VGGEHLAVHSSGQGLLLPHERVKKRENKNIEKEEAHREVLLPFSEFTNFS